MNIQINELDKLASEYIRKRAIREAGGCELCLTPKFDIQKDDGSVLPGWKQLQCCHFYSRRHRSTRHDPANLVGLCLHCHQYFHGHPLEFVEFMKIRLGEEEFERLHMRCLGVKNTDIKLVRIYLNQLLKDLKELWNSTRRD